MRRHGGLTSRAQTERAADRIKEIMGTKPEVAGVRLGVKRRGCNGCGWISPPLVCEDAPSLHKYRHLTLLANAPQHSNGLDARMLLHAVVPCASLRFLALI
jgi:hypothetical protein